jgi:DNA polymerase III subunit epsilon
MRQIVLDTETTGLDHAQGHRIIEIGCVELVNRRDTGRHRQWYLNPDREIEPGAWNVHGIRNSDLVNAPRFPGIVAQLLDFIDGAELVIHNAEFDVGFLDMELRRLPGETRCISGLCKVLDTLVLARQLHPGARNSLDALCRRYSVDNSHRELHGALLDAKILASVYLAMTSGQRALTLGVDLAGDGLTAGAAAARIATRLARPDIPLLVVRATQAELDAHERLLAVIDKASGGRTVWRQPAPSTA